MSQFQLPDGTIFRVAPIAEGSVARPLDAAFKNMPKGVKADLKRDAQDKTVKTFDSGSADDGRVTSTSWGFDIGGLNVDTQDFRDFYAILEDAFDAKGEVWAERKRPGDDVYKGGRCSVMSLPEPVGADNIMDWSATLKGRGLRVDTPVV